MKEDNVRNSPKLSKKDANNESSSNLKRALSNNQTNGANNNNEDAAMSGVMRIRNKMKRWVSRWFVLRDGKLNYWKEEKNVNKRRPSGIVFLVDCEVKEYKISKDGSYSFKVENIYHHSVYPKTKFKAATTLRVTWSNCIFRVSSAELRKAWMEAVKSQIDYANAHKGALAQTQETEEIDDDEEDDSDIATSPTLTFPNGTTMLATANTSNLSITNGSPAMNIPSPSVGVSIPSPVVSSERLSPHSPNPNYMVIQQSPSQPQPQQQQPPLSPSASSHNLPTTAQQNLIHVPIREPINNRETQPETIFIKNDELQKNILAGVNTLQKKESKSVQKQTLEAVEEWKNEFSKKINILETRVTGSLSTKTKNKQTVSLSFLQIAVIVVISVLIGRLSLFITGTPGEL